MTNSKSDLEELKGLQREASERRAERKKPRAKPRQTKEKQSAVEKDNSAATKPATQDTAGEMPPPETEKTIQDLAGQIETIVKEVEEASSERPVLALLAAFVLGVVAGQLFSRR